LRVGSGGCQQQPDRQGDGESHVQGVWPDVFNFALSRDPLDTPFPANLRAKRIVGIPPKGAYDKVNYYANENAGLSAKTHPGGG
jgi:hypothetical protein